MQPSNVKEDKSNEDGARSMPLTMLGRAFTLLTLKWPRH